MVPGPNPGQITITINGTSTTINLPVAPGCVNTRQSALLGPLPHRFEAGTAVSITINGNKHFGKVIAGRKVFVPLAGVPCGVYPMVIRHPGLKPALRIWSLTGGNTLKRFWFPGLPVDL